MSRKFQKSATILSCNVTETFVARFTNHQNLPLVQLSNESNVAQPPPPQFHLKLSLDLLAFGGPKDILSASTLPVVRDLILDVST